MDIQQYFEPVDFSKYSVKMKDGWKYTLGHSIEKSNSRLTSASIHKLDAVIFSVPVFNGLWHNQKNNPAEKIREELYRLSDIGKKMNVADFGQVKKARGRKGIFLALRDIIDYFNELNIVTVVIGGSQDLTVGICEAFKNETFFSLTAIDSLLDVKKGREAFSSTSYLSRIFQKNPQLFQFNLVAYQSHLVSASLFSKTKGTGTHARLGLLHKKPALAEPIFRNTDVLSFDMGALKYSEIPGSSARNPNGLYAEEACQFAKYAGLSNKLKVFGIFETGAEKDHIGITFQLSAQIIWYFLEGINNRIPMEKETPGNLRTFKVEIKEMDSPIVFYQCAETGRWWFEVQSLKGEKLLIACSEKEYKEAAADEIPENWLRVIQKIDELSK
jgi:arginase family enzyme